MTNRWELSNDVKEKYTPIIVEFINKLESEEPGKPLELNLSNTELNPYTLVELLKNIGYEKIDEDSNGWQFDFWITLQKENNKSLSVSGTGIVFELKLSEHID